ncbi:MAG: hypothetical protein HKM95_06420 [Inquilinus sp.]|nr:hypothetical protein [Inquilinus sp.]
MPAEVAAPPRPQDLEITIVGIVTGPRALILVRTDRGQLVPMAEGDDLHGWTLSKIEPLRAIFRRDADETAVPIEYRAN